MRCSSIDLRARLAVAVVLALSLSGSMAARDGAGQPSPPAADAFAARPRILVMTDIANEPDDQMSLVRFLLYANQFDIEGLVASTSTWMKTQVRPDVILSVLGAYQQVQPNLLKHAPGFPTAAALREKVVPGQAGYGMAAVGDGKGSAGAEVILRAAERDDPRPLWVLAWGGTNTLAQALVSARSSRTPAQVEAIVSRLRVYAISDQDDAGPWLRREFPSLHYIVTPSTQDGQQYYFATWTGISGDRYYRNAPGADFSTFSDDWVNANIRSKGPLGKLYPHPCCIHEGDTPTFLGLIDNGLASGISPAYGGWGGRYIWRQPSGESRPFWTQGGDSFPGRDGSRDTVLGTGGSEYTSDQATIWRWRTAFQHDFAARMDWTIKAPAEANHNPVVVVNGQSGTGPITVDAQVGAPLTLDATGTKDPDGHALTYTWFFYPEAGTGIPGQPVVVRQRPPAVAAAPADVGGMVPAPPIGLRPAPARIVVENASTPRATVWPKVPGLAHVILAVEDNGSPSLTSYRRVILKIAPAPPLTVPAAKASEAGARTMLALTFDDLPVHGPVPPGVTRVDVARGVLDALKAHRAPPTYGFVNANGLAESPANADVLRLWREAGHLLGNHTWSHMDLHASTVQAWEQDFLENEPTLQKYMGDGPWRVLRFPYLREGDTAEKRAEVARFLTARGYAVARVTMSFDDWAFTDPYARCSVKGDTAAIEWLKETYLSRAVASIERARIRSRLAFGRDIPQVMLLHAGALGIVMLPRLLDLLEKGGFDLVTLQDAQQDPAYQTDLGPLPSGGMFLDQVLASQGKTPASAPDATFARITGMCK